MPAKPGSPSSRKTAITAAAAATTAAAAAAAVAAVRGRQPTTVQSLPPPPAPVHLSVDELRGTSDSRLLSYLMSVYDTVRGLSLAVPSTGPCALNTPFSAAYVEELLTPRLLSSPIPDVSQLVGCLLCDAVRLHQEQHKYGPRPHNGDSSLTYPGSGDNGSSIYAPSDNSLDVSGSTWAESLPFSSERCVDVLQCICACFARLQSFPYNASPSWTEHQRQSLQRVSYLIERAATAHVFRHLLPHCGPASEETQKALLCVFQAVRCASSAMTGELSSSTRAGSSDTATSTATCEEMVEVLRDILCATSIVTPAQLLPLLEELIAASPTLQFMSPSASSSSPLSSPSPTVSRARISQHLAEHSAGGGALIAARLLLGQMDVLQPAIATWAMGSFEDGLVEVLASDALQSEDEHLEAGEVKDNGSDTDEDETFNRPQRPHLHPRGKTATSPQDAQRSRKRRGLHAIAHVLQVLVALMELHVDLADQLLPALAPHLEHTCPEVRLLLLRGLSAAFAANEAAVRTYRATFTGPLLNRLFDVKLDIRLDAVRLSTLLLRCLSDRGRGMCAEPSRTQALQHDLWQAFQPCWERLLTDPHVLVRRQTVTSVTEAALAAPLLLQPALHRDNMDQGVLLHEEEQPSGSLLTGNHSIFLKRALGLRALDKNRRVRCAAVLGLTRLYNEYRLAWIPNALLDAVRFDSGASSSSSSSTTPVALTPETVIEGLLPTPSSCLLPTTATSATGPTQATLTRWLSATSPGALVATETPALLDFEAGTVEQMPLSRLSHPPDGDEFDEADALLGFGASTTSSTKTLDAVAATKAKRASRDASTAVSAYVEALMQLCQHVDSAHFEQLLRIYEKKPQLRLAIRRLLEFHVAMRQSHGDVKSAEGQHCIHSIHRLLTFLQETTGANKGEWDALFRSRDDTVRRALLRACDAAHTNWVEVREVLLRVLHGRVGTREYAFVQQTLVPQMMFAVQPAHLEELMRRLRRSIYTSPHSEVIVDGASATGALRALLLLTAASPSFVALSTEGLAEALQAAAKQSVGPPPNWCALLLQALQQWATAASTMADTNTAAIKGSTSPLQETLIVTLRAMALASLPMQQTISFRAAPTAATPGSESGRSGTALLALKQLAKQATRTLVALLRVPGYGTSAAAALESLAAELMKRLATGRALTNDVKTVGWLASLRALARCGGGGTGGGDDCASRAGASLLRLLLPPSQAPSATVNSSTTTTTITTAPLPPLLLSLSSLLVAAVEDVSDKAERANPKALVTALAVAANSTEAGTAQTNSAHSTLPLNASLSVAAAIVDGSAKAMVALVLGFPKSPNASGTGANVCSRADVITYAIDALLQGYKAVAVLTSERRVPASIGNCQRRIAIEKQLVKLLLTPAPDISRELAVSVVLSVEEDAHVRHAVQAKLAGHLLRRTCDMRVVALLLLTAISEDTKSSYQRLRGLVETVGDHLRQKQASQGASLSAPSALFCFLEYTIPFLVLLLAHHPYYASEEAENQFIGFQRVWHLLIGELLRHGTQCAGFVVELLSKIKQSDDALAPASDACRVVCDLASRVLLECLGQRQSRAEDLRRYPGAVLLPSFFVRTSRADPQKLLETVFLNDGVRVAANAPFRVPTLSGGVATGGAVVSRGGSRQATSRASSSVRSGGAEDATNVNALRCPPPHGAAACDVTESPSTLRKRGRSPSPSLSAAVSLSPSVRLQDDEEAGEKEIRTQQRERTERAVGVSSSNPDPLSSSAGASEEWGATQVALQHLTIDKVLDDLFHGLTKADIAQLRWKVVRSRLEDALHALNDRPHAQQTKLHSANDGAGADAVMRKGTSSPELNLEGLLQYAKDQLRVWYDRAPAL
ncbi:hypothetical protein JKF63_07030 [Porcisia hertigi]|uniref:Uncharacterized protein n=1 Tax=Porcisia hertigi TaxID=2761500 RepID=A0A836IDH0_9TRYP|nr:hypothetical protein JKF63_07030 [Porcisia hertigi]